MVLQDVPGWLEVRLVPYGWQWKEDLHESVLIPIKRVFSVNRALVLITDLNVLE